MSRWVRFVNECQRNAKLKRYHDSSPMNFAADAQKTKKRGNDLAQIVIRLKNTFIELTLE